MLGHVMLSVKFTVQGNISVICRYFDEPSGLRSLGDVAVEIVVSDTGCGIPTEKLESIFREFEQVESAPPRTHSPGLGLGLAVVARIVEQLGGQLRVDSAMGKGSRFSFLLPLTTDGSGSGRLTFSSSNSSRSSLIASMHSVPSRRASMGGSRGSEIDNLVEALSSSHMGDQSPHERLITRGDGGKVDIPGSANSIKPVKMDGYDLDQPKTPPRTQLSPKKRSPMTRTLSDSALPRLRILIVEVSTSALSLCGAA